MKRPITLDLETVPHDCAVAFVEKPNLDAILPAKNLVDPEKKAADVEKRKQAALIEYDMALAKASLDWNLSRMVALAYTDGETTTVELCPSEAAERDALVRFWFAVRKSAGLVGFCARTFDVPTLIQRSRLLDVDYPHVSLARYGNGHVTDLRDRLTFDDARYEAIMPRTLKAFCRRFGIPVTDEIDGSQIAALVHAGDWDAVRAHVTSDLALTVALARRIKQLPPVTPEPEMSPDQEAVGF